MFKNKYTAKMTALCPNNGEKDNYTVTIETNQFWQVEDIIYYTSSFKNRKIYQEDLTEYLVKRLHSTKTSPNYNRRQGFIGRITITGTHQGVEITTFRESLK